MMVALRVLLSRIAHIVGRHRDEDLSREIDTHLGLMADDYMRRGMPAREAHDAARRAFGGVDMVRQVYREQRGFPMFNGLMQDMRFAVRVLSRDRGFALTAILVLGLGIGVNNMMFTLVYGSTMRGLPIDDADRVLYISASDQRFPDRPLSYPDFEDLRTGARSFGSIAAFLSLPVSVGDEGHAPERFEGAYTSANAFSVIGAAPFMGRLFTADDDRQGASAVVLLGSRAWQSRYGGDPTVLGRSILINGAPATVIGVMPDRSGFPGTAEVWLPLSHAPGLATQARDARTLRVFGRVRDGVPVTDARAEVESIIDRIGRGDPLTSPGLRARVVPINERFFGRATDSVWLAFITASILIVMVSCANAANLMLGRAVLRAREIAIRGSLGAGRARIVCQLLTESAVLASIGGIVGLAISLTAVRIFETAIPENAMPYWLNYTMDARVFAALVGVSFGTVLVFGLIPAIQASKTDVNRVLKDGGRGTGGLGTRRMTAAFLVVELALSVILLAQTLVSFQNNRPRVESDAIVKTTDVLAASVTLPAATYPTPGERLDLYRRVTERLDGISGVQVSSAASTLPLGGGLEQHLDIDIPRPQGETAPRVSTLTIAPRYFEALGVGLQQGRDFSWQDGQPGRESAIVNERFAETYLTPGDRLGRRIRVSAPNASVSAAAWLTIVGVASDVRQRANSTDADPIVYLPLSATPLPTMSLVVRSSLDASTMTQLLRELVVSIDSHLPLYRVMTMSQVIDQAQWNGRVSHRLILLLTVVALSLSIVGLYAVTAHAVGQRTQEIGIRMALGAQPWHVRRMILVRALLQVACGLVLGIVGTIAWDAAFFSGRVDLQFTDLAVLGPVTLLLTVVTFAACFMPVRRAVRLDPVAALRQD